MKSKRNQSLGSIGQKDMINPEQGSDLIRWGNLSNLGNITKKDPEVDYVQLNKEMIKETKAKQFLNKVFTSTKGNANYHNHNHWLRSSPFSS